MKCEKCNKEHDGKYGSGRFCSRQCANSRNLSKETYIKIGQKLRKEAVNCCLSCDSKTKNKRFCSIVCSNDYNRDVFSIKRIEAIKQGKTNFKSIKCVFRFDDKDVRCDSKIEYSCLDYFIRKYEIIDVQRCDFSIEYFYKNKKHRFLPDFIIKTKDKEFIVEAKSFVSSKNLNDKWHFYNETSLIKKSALIDFCSKNNKEPFWFTKDLNIKQYRSFIPV